MTRDDIIRMAREVGMSEGLPAEDDLPAIWTPICTARLEKFAALVAAAEREAKDQAYKERNQLVALLSTCFPSGKAKTAIEGWDESWHGCVYIDFPWGQASWHYHDSHAWMFEHLPPYQGKWDRHTTEEKYSKIAAAIRSRG